MLNSSNSLYEFGPFRLDPVRRVLWREGEIMPLRSKAFDTLLALLHSRGRVLENEILSLTALNRFDEAQEMMSRIVHLVPRTTQKKGRKVEALASTFRPLALNASAA